MKIPKKAAKPLLEEIQLTSPQYKTEILPELVNAVRTINLKELLFKQTELDNIDFRNTIKTDNDFYIYLLVKDRLSQAQEYIKDFFETKEVLLP